LPPSIALGMEPGEKTILKERPRPKDEPVVLGWMWLSMVMNGAVLSAVIIGVYIVSLMHYCDGKVFQADIDKLDDFDSKLMDARTVAFISLVWSENIRSYTSRSFDKPVWHDILGNVNMQKAIVLAQICLYIAVLVPVFSDKILQLRGVAVGAFGWLLALAGPFGCLVLCEACKLITAYQVQQYQDGLAKRHEAEDRRLAHATAETSGASFSGKKGARQEGALSSAAPSAGGVTRGGGGDHVVNKVSGHFVGKIDGSFVNDLEGQPASGKANARSWSGGVINLGMCSCFGLFPRMKFHYGFGVSRE